MLQLFVENDLLILSPVRVDSLYFYRDGFSENIGVRIYVAK